jgi:hypothetical protein
MKSFENIDSESGAPRAHPWTTAESDPAHRYYDLRQHPDLIRTHLEDFTPWNSYAAINTFYRLLEWLNGPESVFESNDCAFEGPHPNTSPSFTQRLTCTGRLMILYRNVPLNTAPNHIVRLSDAIHRHLHHTDPGFELGAIGTTIMQVHYTALPGIHERVPGKQLMLSFWAFGDTEAETMTNLERTFRNLSAVIRGVSDESLGTRSTTSP